MLLHMLERNSGIDTENHEEFKKKLPGIIIGHPETAIALISEMASTPSSYNWAASHHDCQGRRQWTGQHLPDTLVDWVAYGILADRLFNVPCLMVIRLFMFLSFRLFFVSDASQFSLPLFVVPKAAIVVKNWNLPECAKPPSSQQCSPTILRHFPSCS